MMQEDKERATVKGWRGGDEHKSANEKKNFNFIKKMISLFMPSVECRGWNSREKNGKVVHQPSTFQLLTFLSGLVKNDDDVHQSCYAFSLSSLQRFCESLISFNLVTSASICLNLH